MRPNSDKWNDHMFIENLLSPMHLLLVVAIALIVLGPKRLPEAGRGLGSAIRGFRDSLSVPERDAEQPAIETSGEPDQAPGGTRHT